MAVALLNSPEQIVTILAGLRLQLRLLLLDPALKTDERRDACRRAGATAILLPPGEPRGSTAVLPPAVPVPTMAELLRGSATSRRGLPVPATPDPAAFLLLSSGSTGQPKLVLYDTNTILGGIDLLANGWAYTARDRLAVLLPLHHAWGLIQAFLAPLARGTTLYLCPAAPRPLARCVAQHRLTILPAPPLIFRLLLETRFRVSPDFSSLRLALSSGSPLSAELAVQFRRKFGVPLVQSYGSTETGPTACALEPAEGPGPGWRWQPYPGVTIRLVDADGCDVPPGEPGRLLIRSPGCAQAYLDGREATAEVFRRGFVLTGDRGCQDGAGKLLLLGRERPLLNVAGEKVSAAEVEDCLRRHPAVIAVRVGGVRAADADDRVRAVVAVAGAVSARELREFCGARLAAFKIPREIVFGRVENAGLAGKPRLVEPDRPGTGRAAGVTPVSASGPGCGSS